MTPRTRLVIAAAAATPLVFSSALTSAADTTIGDSSAPDANCTPMADTTQFQTVTGSGPSYAVPTDGIITSFTIAGTAGSVRGFKLGRGTDGSVQVIASPGATTVPATGLLTQAVRIPAKAGDLLGQYVSDMSACWHVGEAADRITYGSGDQGVDATATSTWMGMRIAVSARLEADADRDGYGDTTQDRCPGNPAHDPCFTGAIGKPGGKAKVKKTLSAPSVTLQPGVTETFQWFRVTKKKGHHRTVTKAIAGATSSTYKARKKDRGKKILVRITLSAPGFTSASADSLPRKVK